MRATTLPLIRCLCRRERKLHWLLATTRYQQGRALYLDELRLLRMRPDFARRTKR